MNVFKIFIVVCGFSIYSFEVSAEFLPKPFIVGSYSKILQSYDGKEFTLVFWSTTCPPCIKELTLVAETKMYTNQKFIFVSVDYDLTPSEVTAVIQTLRLEKLEHWLFQGDNIQEIINSVDGRWYGEVPRNYYFDEEHNRTRLRTIK